MSWRSRPTGSLVSSSLEVVLSWMDKDSAHWSNQLWGGKERKIGIASEHWLRRTNSLSWDPRVRKEVKEQLIKDGPSIPILYRSLSKDFWRALLFLISSYKNKMVNLIWGNRMIQSQHLVNQLKFPDLKLDFHCHFSSKYHNLCTHLNCQTPFSTITRAI